MQDYFTEMAHLFRPGQVVTDVSSAKENFVRAVYDSIPKGTILCLFILWLALKRGGYEVSHKTYLKVWVGLY